MEDSSPEVKKFQLNLKRLVDIISSVIGLTILSPLFLVVAILIKLDSKDLCFLGRSAWERTVDYLRRGSFVL